MSGRRGTETRNMSEAALVRMEPELAELVSDAAKRAGLTKASWLRELAVKRLDAPQDMAKSSRLPTPDLEEFARLTASVARLNGAMVQLQITFRENGMTDLHASGERVLSDLRSIQASLVDATIMVRDAFRRDPR